jgi:hypothetical protein
VDVGVGVALGEDVGDGVVPGLSVPVAEGVGLDVAVPTGPFVGGEPSGLGPTVAPLPHPAKIVAATNVPSAKRTLRFNEKTRSVKRDVKTPERS